MVYKVNSKRYTAKDGSKHHYNAKIAQYEPMLYV